MSNKSFIDSVEVRKPCSEDWDHMTGTDKIRFCSHCAKDVNNISEMTRKEASRLVRAAGPNLCIRYIPDPKGGRPLFAEQLYRITRRGTGLTAGVMTASLSLSTLAYAQSSTVPENGPQAATAPTETVQRPSPGANYAFAAGVRTGRIEGVVRDLNGKPVPGVTIAIYSPDDSQNDSASTDDEGRFGFTRIEPGLYGLKIESSTGARKAAHGLQVMAGQTIYQDINVSTKAEEHTDSTATESGSGIGFGGVMASIQYSSPLTAAVADDDVQKVRDLINAGAKVNAKDKNYENITPIFVAVENGNVEIVRMLLNAGAKVNAVNKTKRTPLMYIDSDATPELIEMLVRAGADVNAVDEDGTTALLGSVSYLSPEVIKALIDAGADMEKSDKDGTTPLIKASSWNELESVKVLIMSGAVVNARDKSGESGWDKTNYPAIESLLEDYGAVVRQDVIQVTVTTHQGPK